MILNNVFGLERRSKMVVTGAGVQQDATLKAVFGPRGETSAGVEVLEDTPLTLSGWFAAIRLLAWTTAYLPLLLYERKANGDKEIRSELPLYRVLHDRPNPEMNSMVFRELGILYVVLWGNSYAYIDRLNSGEIGALWPLHPRDVVVDRFRDGSLSYDISRIKDPPTSKPVLQASEVLHVPGFGFNGLLGLSLVSFARQHVGEAVATQNYAGGFYAEGCQPRMFITHPGRLRNRAGFRDKWKKIHGDERQRIGVLDEGMSVEVVGMPLKDAQYIESRQFHVTEAARWLGLPPHKIGDLLRATFSNITEQNIEFQQSLLPWLCRFEQEYNYKLFDERDRGRLFVEHLSEALLQGDPVKQNESFRMALQDGWMNRAEVRRKKNLNSMGEEGDVYTVQANVLPLERLIQMDGPADGQTAIEEPAAELPQTEESIEAGSAQSLQVTEEAVLNGAQITAATAIVQAVAAGDLPRDAGLGQLEILFNLDSAKAAKLMGSAGTDGFKAPEKPDVIPFPPSLPDVDQENGVPKKTPEPEEEEEEEGKKKRPPARMVTEAARHTFREALASMIHNEAVEIRRAAKKPNEFDARIEKFYRRLPEKLQARLSPSAEALRLVGVEVDLPQFVADHCRTARAALNELRGSATGRVLPKCIEREVSQWENSLADELTARLFEEKSE